MCSLGVACVLPKPGKTSMLVRPSGCPAALPFLTPLRGKKGFPPYPKNILYGDVIKGLPIPAQSADAVYCSHVLEHMTLEEFRTTLRNVFSYLRPGGTFRLVLPDLETLIRAYGNDPTPEACSRFMHDSRLGRKTLPRGF